MNIDEISYNNNNLYENLKNDNQKLIVLIKEKTEKYEKQIEIQKKENSKLKENIETNLNSYIKEMEKRNDETKELEENIKKKNIEINNKNKEIDKLQENIEKINIEINNLKQNLHEKDIDIKQKNNEIKKLKENLDNRDNEIINCKKEIEKLKDNINNIVDNYKEKKSEITRNLSLSEMKIKRFDYEMKQLKETLEKERFQNHINCSIIKTKDNQIKNANKIFKVLEDVLSSKEKIINNEIDIDNNIKNNLLDKDENINKIEEEDTIENYGKVGLTNKELNCYMNSVIQILKNIKNFSLNILGSDKKDNITESFKRLLHQLYYSKEKYVSIHEFKQNFGSVYKKFKGAEQNDSTYFLIYLLSHFHKIFNETKQNLSNIHQYKGLNLTDSEENELEIFLNKYEPNNNSFIHELFYGFQMNKVFCTGCRYNKISFQSFNILDMPLMDENRELKSIQQCLGCYLFTKDKQNISGFECSICKKKLLSHLTSIIKLPSTLIINLKRVGENSIYNHEIKIPFILKTKDIEKLSKIDKIYEIIGFIKHSGNEKKGHNIAYTKNIFDDKWYSFNDKIVKEEEGLPSTDQSFLLFYQEIE